MSALKRHFLESISNSLLQKLQKKKREKNLINLDKQIVINEIDKLQQAITLKTYEKCVKTNER